MNIGFDAKRLFLNHSGLGNYSRTLVSSLKQHYPEDELTLFSPRTKRDERTEAFFSDQFRIETPKSTPKLLHAWWRSMKLGSLLAEQNIDVFHGLSHELPQSIDKKKVKTVVTIHDLIFLRFPQFYPRIDRNIYKRKVASACLEADHVVAISEKTSRDLQDLLDVPSSKITVIYQGCDDIYKKPIKTETITKVHEKYNIQEPYLISVGSLEERKDQLTLAKSFIHGGFEDSYTLVLVGKQRAYAKQIHQFLNGKQGAEKVLFLENVEFVDLPALVSGATISIYPSLYEGFGLPVLEAMQVGTPVIAANGSCLEEVGGDAACYFEAGDETSLTMALDKLLSNEVLRNEMKEEGLVQSEKFSNEKMVRSYHKLYEELLSS